MFGFLFLFGVANNNSLLDTRSCIVEFLYRLKEVMHANLIAEHIYSLANIIKEFNLILNNIVYHRCDNYNCIFITDLFTINGNNQPFSRYITDGSDLLAS